jgi:hypothetical protein
MENRGGKRNSRKVGAIVCGKMRIGSQAATYVTHQYSLIGGYKVRGRNGEYRN